MGGLLQSYIWTYLGMIPTLSRDITGIGVANMGLVLYIGGDFILRLRIVLLVGMLWADVMCDMG